MRFGIVGRMGPEMMQVVGFGGWSTGGCNFVGKCGVPHSNGDFAAYLCESV